ncbi:MAG: O-antigen ligase family protein [Candidatus Marinimicrobia bacterium]|nr:O-antigen ligase family protein [Candidatus Neomarinimicrobiota bacterium]MCF7828789.1 O-antigen ligase family protein [Candidatus Neomarinimicrobiota bacterium]MCF7880706.1 O-antigen ligase family protein [Candidatus Neomarinimicrobiota bacterium]
MDLYLNKYNTVAVYFFLVSIHVLLMYAFKGYMGLNINAPSFILIKLWKELVISLFILVNVVMTSYRRNKIEFRMILLDDYIVLFLLLGILYIPIGGNLTTSIWSFRSLYEIFFFYMAGRFFVFTIDGYAKVLTRMIGIAVLVSIFAVIQVKYLGTNFFYDVYNVDKLAVAHTAYGYEQIRATSTFITAHEFGLFIVLQILFIPFLWNYYDSNKVKIFLSTSLLIILVGLVFSLSRSSIVILFVCGIIYLGRNFKRLPVYLILGIFVFYVLHYTGAIQNLSYIFIGMDPSSSGRLDVLNEAVHFIMDHPFGSGLGTVGVVVRRFIPTAPQFEGELFNILAQLSIVGLLIYISIYFQTFKQIKSAFHSENKSITNFSISVFLLVLALGLRELILPRDFSNYSWGWFMIGSFVSSKYYWTQNFKNLVRR